MGDRVTHDRYGLGTVTDIADWPRSVTINFGTETRRINIPNDKLAQL